MLVRLFRGPLVGLLWRRSLVCTLGLVLTSLTAFSAALTLLAFVLRELVATVRPARVARLVTRLPAVPEAVATTTSLWRRPLRSGLLTLGLSPGLLALRLVSELLALRLRSRLLVLRGLPPSGLTTLGRVAAGLLASRRVAGLLEPLGDLLAGLALRRAVVLLASRLAAVPEGLLARYLSALLAGRVRREDGLLAP